MPRDAQTDRPRIPLVSPLESRLGVTPPPLSQDEKLVNAFGEKSARGWKVYKRPGLGAYLTLSPAPTDAGPYTVVGQYLATDTSVTPPVDHLLTVVNTPTSSWLYDNGVRVGNARMGSIPAIAPVTFTQDTPGTVSMVIVPYRPAGFYYGVQTYTLATGALNVGAPAWYIALVPGIVTLDSTPYVMDVGANVFGGASGGGTISWPGLNVLPATQIPGAGIYLARHINFVVALKQFSVEFLYDNANPVGLPLSLMQGTTIQWGCVDAGTVQDIDGVLHWLARSRESSFFVARLKQGRHEKISTPAVERLLENSVGPYYSSAIKHLGHPFYVLTIAGANLTLVYDILSNSWDFWTDSGYNYWKYVYGTTLSTGSSAIFAALSGLNLYEFDETFGTDAGSTIPVDIYTPNEDFGTRKEKALERMDFITDQQPGTLLSRWTENDYKTWSNFRKVDLSVERPNLQNNGSFKRRAWNFRYLDPYPLRMEAVELTMSEGD